MQCPNKFFTSATHFSVTLAPNCSPKSSSFQFKTTSHKTSDLSQVYRNDKERQNSSNRKCLPLPPNLESITSMSNPFVKHCVKLRQSSSYRHSHGSLVVVGTTPISEIYSFHKMLLDKPIVECLLVLDDYDIPEELDSHADRVVRVTSAVLKKVSGVQSVDSVEVIAVMRIPSTFQIISNSILAEDCLTWFSLPHRILVLDAIQDPGNLGTLLRSATAFRWGGVFLLPGCCDPFNEKSLRACRGACFQIPIVSGNWTHLNNLRLEFQMKMLAGHPAAATGEEEEDLKNPVIRLSKEFADSVADSPVCLVLGSEGAGLSKFSRNACELVTIPMAGEFESLNVSVAGGILMYMLQPQIHNHL